MPYYPVNLKIDKRLCVVVGGGVVALRKAKGLLQAEARIRVISPTVEAELRILADQKKIEWLQRGYVEGDLNGAFLVFAATNDSDVQLRIKKEAIRSAVILNSADDPGGSDFHVPAHFRRGKMLITISTGGGSPALAKKIREQLEEEIGPEYEAVVDLLSLVRERLLGGGGEEETARYSELFSRLLSKGVIDLLLEANWFELQMLLLRELPEDIDAVALVRQFLEKHDKSR
ncbi:MAG: bifunctional precorrin-2 dehydrogenase/sirohydrochlorin ferrochelatase [Proteobacteria bacterium]|nr:bifunctional precorrin-2 dehydrogenase/sirohydrochlorin ferrochelatase [Pseudomonadota bacterium]